MCFLNCVWAREKRLWSGCDPSTPALAGSESMPCSNNKCSLILPPPLREDRIGKNVTESLSSYLAFPIGNIYAVLTRVQSPSQSLWKTKSYPCAPKAHGTVGSLWNPGRSNWVLAWKEFNGLEKSIGCSFFWRGQPVKKKKKKISEEELDFYFCLIVYIGPDLQKSNAGRLALFVIEYRNPGKKVRFWE